MPLSVLRQRLDRTVGTALLVMLAGCGRVGFEPISETNQIGGTDTGGSSGSSSTDGGSSGGTATNGAGGAGTGARAGAGGRGGAGAASATGGSAGAGGGSTGAGGTGGVTGGAGGVTGGAGGATGGAGSGGSTGGAAGASGGADAGPPDAGPPTCRTGCACEFYSDHRYMLCPDELTYTAARAECVLYGMQLVRIDPAHESSYLRLRSQLDNYPKFHIGANDTGQEGAWRWEDGTQFWSGVANGTAVGGNFVFWAVGEPNNQNANEDCAEIQSIQGWNDSVCDAQTKPFICEDSASCGPSCTPPPCPPGCQCFGAGNRYALCTTPADFRNAAVNCGRNGMMLASIGDATEDQLIRARATTAGMLEFWIGGTDLDSEGQWMWLDSSRFWSGAATGTALGYQHFMVGSPAGGTARNCLLVRSDGTWTDITCTSTSTYVCERF